MYVPIQSSPPPSAQAQELADQLSRLARDYQAAHPGMSSAEVDQAVGLTRSHLQPESWHRGRAIALALALGLVLFGGLVSFFLAQGGELNFSETPLIWIVAGLAIVIAAAKVATLRR